MTVAIDKSIDVLEIDIDQNLELIGISFESYNETFSVFNDICWDLLVVMMEETWTNNIEYLAHCISRV